MRTFCLMLGLQLAITPGLPAQATRKPADIIGTWQLILTRNLKTGETGETDSTANHTDVWMMFTTSHFSVLSAERGRKGISFAEENKLPPDSLIRFNYAKVWACRWCAGPSIRRHVYARGEYQVYENPARAA